MPPIITIGYRHLRKKELIESPLPQIERHSEKMVILGNGPSLNESIEKYKEKILSFDRMVVNFFANTDYYEEITPNFYLFADSAYFNVPKHLANSVNTLVDNIVNKTKWPMRVVVPTSAKGSMFMERLLTNKCITVDYYFDGRQDIGKMNKFEAWDKNLIVPPSQTVLNVAIFLSLFWRYKESYLIGADSSFLEDLRIDQETNEILSLDSHFYNNEEIYVDKQLFDTAKIRRMTGWTLHEIIYAYGRMFEYYNELRQYADYKGLKVYNASEYSWINVFERKKL